MAAVPRRTLLTHPPSVGQVRAMGWADRARVKPHPVPPLLGRDTKWTERDKLAVSGRKGRNVWELSRMSIISDVCGPTKVALSSSILCWQKVKVWLLGGECLLMTCGTKVMVKGCRKRFPSQALWPFGALHAKLSRNIINRQAWLAQGVRMGHPVCQSSARL